MFLRHRQSKKKRRARSQEIESFVTKNTRKTSTKKKLCFVIWSSGGKQVFVTPNENFDRGKTSNTDSRSLE